MALKRAVLVPSDPKPKDGKMKMLVGRVAATYLRKLKKSGSGPVSRLGKTNTTTQKTMNSTRP